MSSCGLRNPDPLSGSAADAPPDRRGMNGSEQCDDGPDGIIADESDC